MSGSVESRADLLLGGRRGRAMLADLAGLDPLRPLAETVASAPAASWWREPTDLRYQCWLGAGAATLLAGWDADQTLWLRDVFTGIRQLTTWHGTPGPGALDDDGASTT